MKSLVCIAIAAAALAICCCHDPQVGIPSQNEPVDVVTKLQESSLRVDVKRYLGDGSLYRQGNGSCGIFSEKAGRSYCLTAKHVTTWASGTTKVFVEDVEARIEVQSDDYDASVISFPVNGSKTLTFDFSTPYSGQRVYSAGYHGRSFVLSHGFVFGEPRPSGEYLFSGQVYPGQSGSPVLNSRGRLVGVLVKTGICRIGGGRDSCAGIFVGANKIRPMVGPYLKEGVDEDVCFW